MHLKNAANLHVIKSTIVALFQHIRKKSQGITLVANMKINVFLILFFNVGLDLHVDLIQQICLPLECTRFPAVISTCFIYTKIACFSLLTSRLRFALLSFSW